MNHQRAIRSVVLAVCLTAAHLAQAERATGEWPYYAGDIGSQRYAPLSQIDARTIQSLNVAWTWESPDNSLIGKIRERAGSFKATPIMIDGVLFTSTSFNQVAAIDAGTGETRWSFDPKAYASGRRPTNSGWQHRGVAYWEGKIGSQTQRRVFIATGIGELIALDAKTGVPVPTFGNNGRVDLQAQLIRSEEDRRQIGFSAPPMIVNDVIVVGNTLSERAGPNGNPAGHIQAFDVRTGAPKWIFRTVPGEKDPGVETWEEESWRRTGNTNAWTMFSADPALGIVYVPTSTPTNDYYGGHRKGNNLYAETLLALDAQTGKLRWHFQGVHHGLWDYDFPAAPNLVDITVNGKRIKAVAQVSKQGFTYVFDRTTGEPVWPIEERPVPQSNVPGEKTSPTQPFPTKPPAFVPQGLTVDDLIDFTPELRAQAHKVLSEYTHGPLFTPPTVIGENGKKGTIVRPGAAGGANWGGAAFDPDSGYLFVQASNLYSLAGLVAGDVSKGQPAFIGGNPMGPTLPNGLPLVKPPYGTVTAIDLNKGEIAWQVPNGDSPIRNHPALQGLKLGPLGASSHTFLSSGGVLATKTLIFVNQVQTRHDGPGLSATEFYLRAFNKQTGAQVWEHKMQEPPFGTPMTYEHKGRQYVVVAAGGGAVPAKLVAFALPKA